MLNAKRNETQAGFTLIEVLVALVITMLVLTATASGLALASQVERETTSLNRARALTELLASRYQAMNPGEIGHYVSDGLPGTVTLPEGICRKSGSSCRAERPVLIGDDRPTGAAMPKVVERYTFDGTGVAMTGKLAKREFEVTTYVINQGSSASFAYANPEDPRRVAMMIKWMDGANTKTYNRVMSIGNTDKPCALRGSVTEDSQEWNGGSFSYFGCAGFTVLGGAANGNTWPVGEGGNGYSTPVRVSGSGFVTDAPLKVYFTYPGSSAGRISTGFENASALSAVSLILWNGSKRNLVKDPQSGVWTTTIPRSTAFSWDPMLGDPRLSFDVTFSNGKKLLNTRAFETTPILNETTPTRPEILGVGTSGAALPGPTGSPTGALRSGATDNNTLNGTITPKLCTKSDGSLWSNQRFYIDIKNSDPQDWLRFNQSNWTGSLKDGSHGMAIRWWADKPESTLSNQKKFLFSGDDFGNKTTREQFDTRYLGTISGATTIGKLNTSRFAIMFPTAAEATKEKYAPLDGSTSTYGYPKFFQKSVELSLTVERQYDRKLTSYSVSIPVYRSSTAAGCTNTTQTQPNY